MPTPRPLTRPLHFAALLCGVLAASSGSAAAQAQQGSAPAGGARADPMARLPRGARHALELPGLHWSSRTSEPLVVYARRGSHAERRLDALATTAERTLTRHLRWLDTSDAGGAIRLFFVDSRDEMVPLTGLRHAGTSLADEGTAFLVASDTAPPAIRHELMHLLSWRLWGTPGGVWLSEGVATYAMGRCRGFRIEDIAAALDRDGALVPLDTLRHQFAFEGKEGAERYLQSASLVGYIDQTYGRRRLRAFWRNGGLGGVRRTLGIDASTLEKRWRATVARRTPTRTWPAMWTLIQARGCE